MVVDVGSHSFDVFLDASFGASDGVGEVLHQRKGLALILEGCYGFLYNLSCRSTVQLVLGGYRKGGRAYKALSVRGKVYVLAQQRNYSPIAPMDIDCCIQASYRCHTIMST